MVPTLWLSSKTYFQENGKTVEEWNWLNPYIHYKNLDDILTECKANPPSVFGFSLYIWNYLEANKIAKTIKELYPDCLIIYGGPQVDIKYSNDFFTLHPWVDLVVPSDVYGEPILTEILDTFDNFNPSKIPEIYYQKSKIKFKSSIPFAKRSFKWPGNIFVPNKEHFNFDKTNAVAIYETTRGCPYRCIYCDWGGGTYTKVVKKPLATVFSELEFLSQQQIGFIFFADANFGIYKEDIEIIEFIIGLKEKYGYPKSVSVENAKNNLDRVFEIQKLLIKHNLNYFYKISIQSPHEDIKQNIERVDIPFSDYASAINELRKEYDAPVLIETIIGMPGDNYQKTLESIDLFHREEVESFRANIWNLLPEAPAYDPAMRAKFNIQTKWFANTTLTFVYKNSAVADQGVNALVSDMILENVVGTYSYTPLEWVDMLMITMLASVSRVLGLNLFTKYLKQHHQINAGEFFDTIYKDIFCKKGFNSDILNEKISLIIDNLTKVATDPTVTRIEFDFDPEFPLLLAPHVYLTFLVMIHPAAFFTSIAGYFSTKVNDDALLDLGHYLSNTMIDFDYDPNKGRKFITNHNWYGYYNNNEPLHKNSYEYIINDDKLKFAGSNLFEFSDYPEQSDYMQKLKQFFYHRGSNQVRNKHAAVIIERKIK